MAEVYAMGPESHDEAWGFIADRYTAFLRAYVAEQGFDAEAERQRLLRAMAAQAEAQNDVTDLSTFAEQFYGLHHHREYDRVEP